MNRLCLFCFGVFAAAQLWGQHFEFVSPLTGGGDMQAFAVANLPKPSAYANRAVVVTDAANKTDCSVGGGTTRNICVSDGAVWRDEDGGGDGGAPGEDAVGTDELDDSDGLPVAGAAVVVDEANILRFRYAPVDSEPQADAIPRADASGKLHSGWLPGSIASDTTGNAATASKAQANPANCPSGSLPRGVADDWAAEGCAAVDYFSELANVPEAFPAEQHKASHQHGGSDEIASVIPSGNAIPKADASGALDPGFIPMTALTPGWSNILDKPAAFPPAGHGASHRNGGADEIATAVPGPHAIPKADATGQLSAGFFPMASLTPMWGNVQDKPSEFTPSAHTGSHRHGGSDEVATAVPGAHAIPKANGSGRLDPRWLGKGSTDASSFLRGDGVWTTPPAGGPVEWGKVENKPATFPASPHSLESHADVNATGVQHGSCLVYDGLTGNRWVPGNCGGGSATPDRVFNVLDYGAIGDGVSNETAAIQAAIDAAEAAGGGVVYVPRGSYVVNRRGADSRCLLVKSNIHLKGDGPASVLKLANDQPISSRILGPANGFKNVTISDLAFDGNKANQSNGNEHMAAIFVLHGEQLRIRDIYVENTFGDAVQLWGNTDGRFLNDVVVSGITTVGTGRHGVTIEQAKNVAVLNNSITPTPTQANSHCIDYEAMGGSDREDESWGPLQISHNVCELGGSDNDGVQIASKYPVVASVTANVIRGGNDGILLSNASGSVSNNQIFDSSARGIYVYGSSKDLVVSSNFIRTGAVPGVLVQTLAGDPQRITVADNMLVGDNTTPGTPGIKIRGAKDVTVQGNTISQYHTAIYIEQSINNSETVVIGSNILTDFEYGVRYHSLVTPHDIDLRITDNVIKGSAWAGGSSKDAIRFTSSPSTTFPEISGNMIEGVANMINRVNVGVTLMAYVDSRDSTGRANLTGFRGNPEGEIAGNVRDRFTGSDGSEWVKSSGNGKTGWVWLQSFSKGPSVSSATAMTLGRGSLFGVTGSTNIARINGCEAATEGRQVTLRFTNDLTVQDGGNLSLAGAFNASAGDTLTLACDGGSWYELSRSDN